MPLQEKIRNNVELEDSLRRILPVLKEIKAELAAADDRVDAAAILEHRADTLQQEMEQEDKANALSSSARKGYQLILHTLRQDAKELRMKDIRDANAAVLYIKEAFDEQVGSMQAESSRISQELAKSLCFCGENFRRRQRDADSRNGSDCQCGQHEVYQQKWQQRIFQIQQKISVI